MRNRNTLSGQDRTGQDRTGQHSTGYNCALFASCGALETEYYIRDG